MIDDADQAAANEERAMEIFQRSRQERVSAPNAAGNTRINCVDCGEIVPPARLQAVPRTLRCARCAADVEARWNS